MLEWRPRLIALIFVIVFICSLAGIAVHDIAPETGSGNRPRLRRRGKMPQRLTPIVAPVCLIGLASVLFAGYSFATEGHSASSLLGVAALLAASTLASHYPVPIEGPNSGGVSLSFVFAASAIVLFGWDAGVLVAFAAPVVIQLTEHRPLIRIAYNGSVFACAAAVGGLLVSFISGGRHRRSDREGRRVRVHPVRAQPHPDLARRRRDGKAAVLRADQSRACGGRS